jgi:hypothetical protein
MLGRNNKGMRTRIHVKLHLHLWREWIRKKDASINRKKLAARSIVLLFLKEAEAWEVWQRPKSCLRNHSCCIFAKNFSTVTLCAWWARDHHRASFSPLCKKPEPNTKDYFHQVFSQPARLNCEVSTLAVFFFSLSSRDKSQNSPFTRHTFSSLNIFFLTCGALFLTLCPSFSLTFTFFHFRARNTPFYYKNRAF